MFRRLLIAQLKMLLRNRGALIAAIIFPIFFAGLLGAATRLSEGETKLAVVNQGGESGAQLIKALRRTPGFRVTELKSATHLQDAFENKQLDGAIVVPRISKTAVVTFVYDEKNAQQAARSGERVQSFIQRYNVELAGGSEVLTLQASGLRTPGVSKPQFRLALPGILMFSVIFSALSFGGTQAVKYRESGVFKRLMVTPVSPRSFLFGESITRALLAICQTALVLVVGVVFEKSLPPIETLWLLPLAVMGVMVFINLGFVAAGLSDNSDAVGAVTNLIGIVLVIMSGGLLESLFPPQVGKAVEFLPITPMVNAMLGVVIDGANPIAAAPLDTAVLAAWMLGTFVLAIWIFRFRAPSKR